jgi:hypothetical protein
LSICDICVSVLQAKGGDGYNGGSGGRVAGDAGLIQFIGKYQTQGGAGSGGGEMGAAGTVLLKNRYHETTTLRVYNSKGTGVSLLLLLLLLCLLLLLRLLLLLF